MSWNSARDFLKPVTLEASVDGARWETIATAQPVFRMPEGAARLSLSFAPAAWRRFRLTLEDRRTQPIPLTGARIPIYVDSPLAINATEIFKKHPECFDEEVYGHILKNHDPFGLNQLKYVRSAELAAARKMFQKAISENPKAFEEPKPDDMPPVAEDSKKLNDLREPCIIIAASGMCEAGRILHHLANNISNPLNTILIVGYQAEHTLGRRLVEQEPEVKIFGTMYRREAQVVVHNSFSAHADGKELLTYVGRFDRTQLQQVFLVHGELERQKEFQSGLKKQVDATVEIPVRGERFTW